MKDKNFKTAERAGFEPAVPFRDTHTFQACPFNHSGTSPYVKKLLLAKIAKNYRKTKFRIIKIGSNLKKI